MRIACAIALAFAVALAAGLPKEIPEEATLLGLEGKWTEWKNLFNKVCL